MRKFPGWVVMALCCCMLCAATVHAKSLHKVYLKDGGIIECQSYRQENGRVMVLVNRDVLVVLAPEEVNMKRTFAKKPVKRVKKAKAAEKDASVGKVQPAAAPQTPAPSGKAPTAVGTTGAAPKAAAQPPGSASKASDQKPGVLPSPQKTAAQSPGSANQAPGQKPAVLPSPQKTAAQSPGSANEAPGQKPAVPPSPQKTTAPASTAKPVSQGQEPPTAKVPVAPVAPSGRTTLPIVSVKPADSASVALGGMLGLGTLLPFLLLLILFIASFWKVFTKAGEAGWQSIIPLYNLFILVKISGIPWWWFLLLFVPVVNIIVYIVVLTKLAARFNKGVLFGLGLVFLGFIFFPILAFGKAEYQ